jgi:hypothetical protein
MSMCVCGCSIMLNDAVNCYDCMASMVDGGWLNMSL